MHCIVTAGPTYEPLDDVRRLTNFSSGRLGSELVTHLTVSGHQTTLLIGQQATYRGERQATKVITFGTTSDLSNHLRALSAEPCDAVFHAAAVSDFAIGKLYRRDHHGKLEPVTAGKISTREGTLLAELVPTEKIIGNLAAWFPSARIIGWKYEVDGTQADAIDLGRKQIQENQTTACVVNGPAYGIGFGIVSADGSCQHIAEAGELYAALERLAAARSKTAGQIAEKSA